MKKTKKIYKKVQTVNNKKKYRRKQFTKRKKGGAPGDPITPSSIMTPNFVVTSKAEHEAAEIAKDTNEYWKAYWRERKRQGKEDERRLFENCIMSELAMQAPLQNIEENIKENIEKNLNEIEDAIEGVAGDVWIPSMENSCYKSVTRNRYNKYSKLFKQLELSFKESTQIINQMYDIYHKGIYEDQKQGLN
jgi:hypothetical protein